MKYKLIKDKEGFKVKYKNGNSFDYVDNGGNSLGGIIKIWKNKKTALNWINKNCLIGKPEIEEIFNK